MIHVTHDVQ